MFDVLSHWSHGAGKPSNCPVLEFRRTCIFFWKSVGPLISIGGDSWLPTLKVLLGTKRLFRNLTMMTCHFSTSQRQQLTLEDVNTDFLVVERTTHQQVVESSDRNLRQLAIMAVRKHGIAGPSACRLRLIFAYFVLMRDPHAGCRRSQLRIGSSFELRTHLRLCLLWSNFLWFTYVEGCVNSGSIYSHRVCCLHWVLPDALRLWSRV